MSLYAVRAWLGKGAWTIVDQGLFAGSNFILSVLLARWLSVQDYGAYSIALTVFWMAGTVHTGLLSEPMLVFGPGRFKDNLASYTAFMLRGHAALTLCIAMLLMSSGLLFGMRGNAMLAQVFQSLAVAQFFILLMWMMRKACYVRLRPYLASQAGAIYALIMLPAAYLLFTRHVLNSWSAIMLLCAASLAASLWILVSLRINPFARIAASVSTEAIGNHLTYGRWAAATGIIMWIPEQVPFLVLGAQHGLDKTAAAKALWNFAMPVAHAGTALSVLLVPIFVRIRTRPGFVRTVAVLTGVVSSSAIAYWMCIGLWGRPLMMLFYKGRYIEYTPDLWLIGAITVASVILSVLTAHVRALERPAYVFWAYSGASALCLTLGLALMYRFGVTGALMSMALSLFLAAALMVYFLTRILKSKNQD